MKQLNSLLEKEKNLTKKINPLGYFPPIGKQEEFIKGIAENKDITVFVLSAGNGLGKTALLINILGNFIWKAPNKEFFNYDIFTNFPYPKRARIVTESKNVEDIGSIQTEIKVWWRKRNYKGYKAGKQYISHLRANGWVVDIMTYEQEVKEFESATLGLVIFDEPPSEEIFNACIARLRKGGIVIIGMTPLKNAAWICDRIDREDLKWFVVYADVEDACKIHGIRGHLEHKNIERMIAEYDDEEKDARAYGKFVHLSHRIWREFDRKYHVIPENSSPRGDVQYGMVIDPHGGKPFAIGYFWVDRRGQIVFYDEYPKENFTRIKNCSLGLKDYLGIIREMDGGKPISWRIIDRHFANNRDIQTELTLKEQFEKQGLDFEDSYNVESEIDTGILVVKGYLRVDKNKPLDNVNFPKLLITANCGNIIRSMERWATNLSDGKPDKTSPYKDHADLARYVCNHNIEFVIHWTAPPAAAKYRVGR